jgi:amino acid transporter
MKYIYKALIILLISFAGLIAANELLDVELNTLHLSLLALFMYGTSMLVHHFTVKASAENPKRFPAYFMAITGLKMMVYILLLGAYVFLFKETAIPIVITFLILYLAFTVLEVLSAVSELKSKD